MGKKEEERSGEFGTFEEGRGQEQMQKTDQRERVGQVVPLPPALWIL